MDETYVRVNGVWRYVYRAVDQHGHVIDVYVSKRRNIPAATTFFEAALATLGRLAEVTTDLAAPLVRAIDELIAEAFHDTEQYSSNRIENDHGRLKARLRPMHGLRTGPVDAAKADHCACSVSRDWQLWGHSPSVTTLGGLPSSPVSPARHVEQSTMSLAQGLQER